MDGGGRLEGRVAPVPGGASGPGRATAVALAEAGAHVAVAGIDSAAPREKAVELPDGTERPVPCRVRSVIPAAMDTPKMEQWGIPSHLMMPPSAVAGMVRTLLLLDPSACVPEMQVVPRLEPNFPR
jgi:NAD(P)-dependent dehydrogenase (short-subunit alcohol dehydrogenase family)